MMSQQSPRYGATLEEWQTILAAGLAGDAITIVANPTARKGKSFATKPLGKAPSKYTPQRLAIGISQWQDSRATPTDIKSWSSEPDYSAGIIGRTVIGLDVDIDDPVRSSAVRKLIEAKLTPCPVRTRPNSGKFLIPIRVDGPPIKKIVVTTQGGKIEVLGQSQQFVAFGTHPSGVRYQWEGGSLADAPKVSERDFQALIETLQSTFGTEELAVPAQTVARSVRAHQALSNDPVGHHLELAGWTKGRGAAGVVHIRCPFESEHTTPTGESDTTYFPAHTGGFARGHFKCMHSHCENRSDAEFLAAVGFVAPSDDWPTPVPLPNDLPPVAPFCPELLPQCLRPWVMDIAHRMQCPPDFTAVGALVALSSLVGARIQIQPKEQDTGWRVVPNLWGMNIGLPGVKKSPALSEVLKPLTRLEAAERVAWETLRGAWTAEKKLAEMLNDANEKKAKELVSKDKAKALALLTPVSQAPEPKQRQMIVNDATVEKLGEILSPNPDGLLSYRDELHGLLTSLAKQGQEGSRGFYLQAYDGDQGYTFERVGRGTVRISRVCLALLGNIQPGLVQSYVRGAVDGGESADGMLQRFGLTVWPDNPRAALYVDQAPDQEAHTQAAAIFSRLAQLPPSQESGPQVWAFTPAAQSEFRDWLFALDNDLLKPGTHPALLSHLSKYRKLIPALSLLFALIDSPGAGAVDSEHFKRATEWDRYLRTHAARLYAAAVVPETGAAASLLEKIKGGKLCDRYGVVLEVFTPREVAQKGWAGLATSDEARSAADLLADFDWLRHETAPSGATGGRPSDRYLVNPSLWAKNEKAHS